MNRRPRVVVVTGGAGGIGAAIARACGHRGDYVVTLDPVVELDGSPRTTPTGRTTAQEILDAGGRARASEASVTDAAAVRQLLTGLVDEFGGVDAIVNVAGISRPTGFAHGTEEDWSRVLGVHLGGYLTLLREALPLFAAARRGCIVGVTSGSGWREADAGAYSCAKRAVASLTWQLGRNAPEGVSVNALSPIAATRMVARALARMKAEREAGENRDASGGVPLAAALPPEALGPVGAYLAGEAFTWCSGEVLFVNGAEISLVAPPQLIELVPTTAGPSGPAFLGAAIPATFATAEMRQIGGGGSAPRLPPSFDTAPTAARIARRCLLVAEDTAWRSALTKALEARGFSVLHARTEASDFASVLREVDRDADIPNAVVVALACRRADVPSASASPWMSILDDHAGIEEDIRRDAAWMRAVAEVSAREERPLRIVTVTAALSPGGRSRAMAAAQLARAAHGATDGRVDAFSIAVESGSESAQRGSADLVGHLVTAEAAGALSGAELVVNSNWTGLRSHPSIRGTISYGGPELPPWIDAALRQMRNSERGIPK